MSCCELSINRSGLQETLKALPSIGWYYGNITVDEAERLLQDEPNGAFLVRDTTDSPKHTELFTITFKIRSCCGSLRVDYSKGYFTLSLSDPGLPLFRTLMDLVGYSLNRSVVQRKPVCVLTGQHQSRNVFLYLTKPVNRHYKMHSLQHHCRRAIRENVTLDKIPHLPLPQHLIENYIMHNPLFDAQLYPIDEDDNHSEMSSSSTNTTDVELDTDR
jgi:hypothetical protein